jgi:hypothetical protein
MRFIHNNALLMPHAAVAFDIRKKISQYWRFSHDWRKNHFRACVTLLFFYWYRRAESKICEMITTQNAAELSRIDGLGKK